MIGTILASLLTTVFDVLPIAAVLLGFQVLVLRQKPKDLVRVLAGFAYVLVGLSLFLVGLEQALFPLGGAMAKQLTDPTVIGIAVDAAGRVDWAGYAWVYVFAASIGFATTVAEPALIAVALKAQDISGGGLNAVGLRIAVAVGVGIGVAMGAFRIVTGDPLYLYIVTGYVGVVLLTVWVARGDAKWIIPLAYDSGGVTTSTVTVPIVTALGLGLASTIPGRSPILDGFGLIAFASLFPMLTVMGFVQFNVAMAKRAARRTPKPNTAPPNSAKGGKPP